MGVHRTCGEPGEIELTPMGVKLNGSLRVHRSVGVLRPCPEPKQVLRACPRKRAGEHFGWVFFLISPAHLHVQCTPVGRTCR